MSKVGKFLNRVNTGVNQDKAAKRKERAEMNALLVDAGMTYATRGTNKIGSGAAPKSAPTPKKAKGGKIDFSKRTSDDFKLGELVYDTSNKRYGTIIGIYDNYNSDKYEVRLDSDGMQPTENLRKLNESGDNGTKKQLFEAVASMDELTKMYPDSNYPKIINNPFYAKGGKLEDIEYEKVYDILKENIDDTVEDLYSTYEGSERAEGEEVESKSRDGFIPYTNGGYYSRWFEYSNQLEGSGISLPTKSLDDKIEEFFENNIEYAKERFKEDYPEIVEELGIENIDYNSLYDAGYSDEAEELSEYESDDDDSVMMEIQALYYSPDNDRGEDGKHTIGLSGVVNLEAPYHRSGNLEDYIEKTFTFSSYKDLEDKLEKGLSEVLSWFEGDMYSKKSRELKLRRMGKGGETKKDDKFIQKAVAEMEKKGTKGAFTKKANRRDMSVKQFTNEVLNNPSEYDLKTRRQAQFVKNVTKYEWGGKVDTGVGVSDTLNKAYEYAKGGEVETFDFGYVAPRQKTIKGKKYNIFSHPKNMTFTNEQKLDVTKKLKNKGYEVKSRNIAPFGSEEKMWQLLVKKQNAKGGTMKKQGYNDKLDESLSMRKGKASTKKQSDKDRRDESKGMEKSMGKRAYESVGTMDKMAKGGKTQGYNDKLDESLGNRKGKESTKKQSLKDRRDESKGEEKALGKRAYSSVSTMDKLLPFLSWHKK
jgi:hypothetical protein